MKSFLAAVLCLLLLVLTSCAKSNELFTCDLCGKSVTGTKHEVTIAEQGATICDDCYEQISEIREAF